MIGLNQLWLTGILTNPFVFFNFFFPMHGIYSKEYTDIVNFYTKEKSVHKIE